MKKSENLKKKVYESPKANFVPLKVEERLLACTKVTGNPQACDPGAFKDS